MSLRSDAANERCFSRGVLMAGISIRSRITEISRAIAIMAICSVSVAGANELSWLKTSGELSALSQIGSAYAAAARCDRLVNTTVVADALSKAFGERSFSPIETAGIVKLVIGTQAAQQELLGPPTKKYCAEVAALFGPKGSQIRGFFD